MKNDLKTKRKRRKKHEQLAKDSLILTIITGIILVATIIITNVIEPTTSNLKLFALETIIVVMIISGVLFIIFFEIFLIEFVSRKTQNTNFIKVHKKLSSHYYTKVIPKNWDNPLIPAKEVHCLAKLDDDGKVIYRIHACYESKLNINTFCDSFRF